MLANLSRTVIGDQSASFLGAMIMAKMRHAGMARVKETLDGTTSGARQVARKDFYLYLNEFHSFMPGSLMNFFSEARAFGFAVTVAHQYIAQIDPPALSAVLGNVGTLIVFRVSGEDAEKFESEMAPVFKAKDIINLAAREFYIKEMIDGGVFDPFSAETLTILPPPYAPRAEQVIFASRERYATALARVQEISYEAQ